MADFWQHSEVLFLFKKAIAFFAVSAFLVAEAILPAMARGHSGSNSHSASHSTSGFHKNSNNSASTGTADHIVHGYVRKNGTYVSPYHATNPNHTKNDNYSTKGNINPYTGKAGTKPRDR